MNMNSPLNEFLKTNPTLRDEIISILAGGRPARWKNVAVELSVKHKTINCAWSDDITLDHLTPRDQSVAFIDKLCTFPHLNMTVGDLVVGCEQAHYGLLAENIKAKL